MKITSTKKFEKDLQKLGSTDSKKVISKISVLKDFPKYQQNVKKIVGKEDVYRLRIGGLRVVFSVDYKRDYIILTKVDYRGNIYRP